MRKVVLLVTLICAFGLVSCRKTASKMVGKGTEETIEVVAEKTAKTVAKKGTKELAEETAESVAKKTLKELAASDKAYKKIYDNFSEKLGKEFADGITANTSKEGLELASKEFPVTKIRVNKNVVTGSAGSLKNEGPMNEFLNFIMPNKTYIVDVCFVYKTDNLGRITECSAKRTKAYQSIERNAQRNTHIQSAVVERLDGRKGLDDAGHLFANTTGGPNELINQVPMASELNRTGKWRELERIEEDALKAGKDVVSSRKLLYKGDSKRPWAIEFTTKIDGVETKTLVENI